MTAEQNPIGIGKMDAATKDYLDLMHKGLKEDHAEVQRRLEVIEQNQREFQTKIALKSDVERLHERISEAKNDYDTKLEIEKKRIGDLEKKKAELEGSLKTTKFWGCVVGGILLIVEIIVVIYK